MIEPPIDERYEIAAVKQSLTTDERKLAEQAYTLLAHDYEANPIGSRDWVIFWTGWRNRAELSLATIENSHQPAAPVPAQPDDDDKYDECLRSLVRQVALLMDDCEEHENGEITIDCDISQGFLRRIYDLLDALEDAGCNLTEPPAFWVLTQPAVPDDVAKDAARYRWMRADGPNTYMTLKETAHLIGDAYDAAIDAAILSATETEGRKDE